jgi:hypothetical protein
MAVRESRPLESVFDLPADRYTVGPIDPDELREFMEEDPRIEIHVETMRLIELLGFPKVDRRRASALGVHTGTTLARIEEMVPSPGRMMEPWMLIDTVRQSLCADEPLLEKGGHQNLFWIPGVKGIAATVVYLETTDGKFHIAPHSGARIERFARIFVPGHPF